jgi:hypothetical protein
LLSVQVLPKPLKELAIQRLQAIKLRVPEFRMVKTHPELLPYTLAQIQDNINYINAVDQSDKWEDCVEFNRRLDASRNSKAFTDVTMEFKDYV